jgi:hypothetical protein
MKAPKPWITYRTRFLVQAKQLNSSLTFTDVLGRSHSGRKGDYLVESSDGVLRIASRQIFEDVYVPLLSPAEPETNILSPSPYEPPYPTHATAKRREARPALPVPLARKSPQPERNRRHLLPGFGSL